MKPTLDIIIPTFDNIRMLTSTINSFLLTMAGPITDMTRFIIVNNGKAPLENYIQQTEKMVILNPGQNLGWEGGLKAGLEVSDAPFVLFANDDIRLIPGQYDVLWRLLSLFNDPTVGAVGPSSNFVMGNQNIFNDNASKHLNVKFLIGFFYLVRRAALDKAGGVDDSLPGGDDIDLSIRLRDAGYQLVCKRDIFVFHHGAQTGNRVAAGYWNSPEMQEKTNLAIIKKHGMLKFWETMVMGSVSSTDYIEWQFGDRDIEGELCAKHVVGEKVLELGCGGRKTVPGAVGVDLHQAGEKIPFVTEGKEACQSDLVADVSVGLPVADKSQDTIIARHILEHCQDPVGTLAQWSRALRQGGALIVAVPDPALGNTVLMNPEHVVSFSPASLRNMASCAGFEQKAVHVDINGVSFVSIFEKIGDPNPLIETPKPTVHALGAKTEEPACA